MWEPMTSQSSSSASSAALGEANGSALDVVVRSHNNDTDVFNQHQEVSYYLQPQKPKQQQQQQQQQLEEQAYSTSTSGTSSYWRHLTTASDQRNNDVSNYQQPSESLSLEYPSYDDFGDFTAYEPGGVTEQNHQSYSVTPEQQQQHQQRISTEVANYYPGTGNASFNNYDSSATTCYDMDHGQRTSGYAEHYLSSAGQESYMKSGMKLGGHQRCADDSENSSSVILHVQTFTDCKVELPPNHGSSYLAAFGANSIRPPAAPLKIESNRDWNASWNNDQYYSNGSVMQSLNKAEVGGYDGFYKTPEVEIKRRVHNEQKTSVILPTYEGSATNNTQREGQRLVLREQRRTSIYIDYPISNDGFQPNKQQHNCFWPNENANEIHPPYHQAGNFQQKSFDYGLSFNRDSSGMDSATSGAANMCYTYNGDTATHFYTEHSSGSVRMANEAPSCSRSNNADYQPFKTTNDHIPHYRTNETADGQFMTGQRHQVHRLILHTTRGNKRRLLNLSKCFMFSRISVQTWFTSVPIFNESSIPREYPPPASSTSENIFAPPRSIPWIQRDSYITPSPYSIQNHANLHHVPVIGRTNYTGGSTKRSARSSGKVPDSKMSCQEPNCSKRFSRSQDLQVHVNKHHLKMLKPYVCNQCPKSFKRPDQLKRHEKIHTGEKPHSCRVCGRGFARTDHRNMHENKHSDDDKLQSMKLPRQVGHQQSTRPSRRKLTKPERFDPIMRGRPVLGTRIVARMPELQEAVSSTELTSLGIN